MMTYFVVSDVHSFYTYMMNALLKAGFDEKNPNHCVISCGDIFDRGTESKQMLDFFYKMYKEGRAILIKGNHEDLFQDMVKSPNPSYVDLQNGTIQTFVDLQTKNVSVTECLYNYNLYKNQYDKRVDELYSVSLNYFETERYIFVHGWVPCEYVYNSEKGYQYKIFKNWRKKPDSVWRQARWFNGMKCAEDGATISGKTIVCGHWHTGWAHARRRHPDSNDNERSRLFEFEDEKCSEIFQDKGIIAIDACTAHFKRCNCLRIEQNEL